DPRVDALAPPWRIESLPLGIPVLDFQEREQRREGGLQGRIQRQQLADHLLAYLPGIVPTLDLEVSLEETDDRQVGSGLAVRDRPAVEDLPALRPVRSAELPVEARLADTRLPYDRDDLSMAGSGVLQGVAEV